MKEIREESKRQDSRNTPQGVESNQYTPLEDEREYVPEINPQRDNNVKSKQSAFTKRIKKGAWVVFVVGIISMIVYSMGSTSKSVDTSEEAASALETHISTSLAAGTKLLAKDEHYVGGDMTITHDSDNEETTLYVWDYAAEDGDYVQVFVNGTSLGEPFMITNTPVTFTIPTVGEVEVLGTRDGGGGITYAVYYDMNHTTYFNGMDENGSNIYTLIRE